MTTQVGTNTVGAQNTSTPYDSLPHRVGVGTLRHTKGEVEAFNDATDELLAAVGAASAPAAGQIKVEHVGVPGGYIRTKITLDGVQIASTDAGASGFSASQALAVFSKKGTVRIVGGQVILTTVATGLGDGTGFENSQNIEVGVGTAAAGAGALSGTEEDIIAGANFQLTSYAAADQYLAPEVTAASIDGTTTAPTLYLNLGGADAAHDTANDTITLTGTIYIDWIFYPAEFL